jgi:flagellar motor switch protein FliM
MAEEADLPATFSQDEIDQLLDAIKAGDTKMKNYDFKQPNRFSRKQMRTASIIHEIFAREITNNLPKRLRAIFYEHEVSVDQLTYEEFIHGMPAWTTIAVLKVPPLPGNIVMGIGPSCTAEIIHLIFGGTGYCKTDHKLTFLEKKAMADVIELNMLPALRKSWEQILETKMSIEKIETDPYYYRIVPPNEMVLFTTLTTPKCDLGGSESIISICIPYPTLYPVLGKLSALFGYSSHYNEQQLTPETRQALFQALDDSYIPISVEFGKTIKSLGKLREIGEGTVIELDKLANEDNDDFDIIIGDYVIAKGEVIVLDERLGIRITKVNPDKTRDPWDNHRGFLHRNGPYRSNPAEPLDNINVPVSIELGGTRRKISQLKEMELGSILELDKLAGEPLDVIAGGCCIAKGEAVVIGANFGIRITEIKGKKAEGETNEQSETL